MQKEEVWYADQFECYACSLLCCVGGVHGASDTVLTGNAPLEYELKAAFVYNFARFVTWPSQTNKQADDFIITILGDDPFGAATQGIEGKKIGRRHVVVKKAASEDEVGVTDILFVGRSGTRSYSDIIEHFQDKAVLTIGDEPSFARKGGVIGFRIDDNRVRFDINTAAAERHQLHLSSQLLKLANKIYNDNGIK